MKKRIENKAYRPMGKSLCALLALTFTPIAVHASSVANDSASVPSEGRIVIDVLANDSGAWVSAEIGAPSNGMVNGAGGGIEYQSAPGYVGSDSFTYTLTDDLGVDFTATVTVDVTSALLANDDLIQIYADTTITIAVLDNDFGAWTNGDLTQPANGAAVASGPEVQYTPNAEFTGLDQFTYTLYDGGGVESTATVYVNVAPPLLVQDDNATTNTDTPVYLPVLDNDTGAISNASFTAAANGTVTQSGPQLLYQPNPGFRGIDTFTYTLTDEPGGQKTATVTVAVNDVVFSDVTSAAGLTHVQHQLPEPTTGGPINAANHMSGGAAAADYDADGCVDLAVTRVDASPILYRNNCNGTFSDVTAGSGLSPPLTGSNGIGWADVDNDDDLDLYITSIDDTRFYLYIQEAGSFSEQGQARGASIDGIDTHIGYSVTFGDYDGDGYLDIHTAEWRPDAANASLAPSNSRLLHNLGAAQPGYFEDVTISAGVSIDGIPGTREGAFSFASRFADLDRDGCLDLAIASDFSESRLFWNNCDGTFSDGTAAAGVAGDENGMGSAIADANGDGLDDWFITSVYDPEDICLGGSTCGWGTTGNRLYLNNGDRTFTDATDSAGVRDGGWGWGAVFVDYDNDGDQDLMHTNGVQFPWQSTNIDGFYNDQTRFWENDGTGVFTEMATAIGVVDNESGKGILKFDFDIDGDLDVLVLNNKNTPNLYRNDGGNSNSWLRVEIAPSSAAIGAVVSVTPQPGDEPIVVEVNAGNNFLGQDEVTPHIGLGALATPVSRVTVQFPTGETQVYDNVAINAVLQVIKGSEL